MKHAGSRQRVFCAAALAGLTHLHPSVVGEARSVQQEVYFSSGAMIVRTETNGSNPVVVVNSGLTATIYRLAVDPFRRRVYWTQICLNCNDASVMARDLGGPSVVLASQSLNLAFKAIAVDKLRSKVYWATTAGGGAIQRANTEPCAKPGLTSLHAEHCMDSAGKRPSRTAPADRGGAKAPFVCSYHITRRGR